MTDQFNGIFQPKVYNQNLVNPLEGEQMNNAASMGNYGGSRGFGGIQGDYVGNMGWGSQGMGQAIGLGAAGIQGLTGLANAYLGMKNYGLAKDTLASNKQQYWNNFTSQARLTNAQLRDRQIGRVARGESSQGVNDYMTQNGVNEKGYV